MGRATLKVSAEFLAALCKPNDNPRRFRVTKNALPPDARIIGGCIDHNGLFNLTVESRHIPRFKGTALPVLDPPEFTLTEDPEPVGVADGC